MSTQEAAVITLKMCKSICSDIKYCKSHSCDLNQYYSENDVTSHAPGNNFKAPGNDFKAAVLPNCVTAQECIHKITMACSL